MKDNFLAFFLLKVCKPRETLLKEVDQTATRANAPARILKSAWWSFQDFCQKGF